MLGLHNILQSIPSKTYRELLASGCITDEEGNAILMEDGNCVLFEAASGANSVPVIESLPTIGGFAEEGQTLTAFSGSITGQPVPTVSWQWESSADGSTGWSNISGATSSTYTVQSSDEGNYIRIAQSATNSEGSDTEFSVATSQVPVALISSLISSFDTRVEADGGTVESANCLIIDLTFLTQN